MKLWTGIGKLTIAMLLASALFTPRAFAAQQCDNEYLKQQSIHFTALQKVSDPFERLLKQKQLVGCFNPKQVFALLNHTQRHVFAQEAHVTEFTLRYFTDLTVALYLKWDLSKEQIQVLEKDLWEWKVAYFSTFKLNNETVQKLLAVTNFENAQKIVSAINTVDKSTRLAEKELQYVSLDWVNKEYIWDVEKYPIELQKIFMDIFNKYAPNLTGMPLDDLHYELTGTFNAVDNNPKRALEDAQYVKDTFGWDLSPFVEYAQNAKIEQDQRVAHHEKEIKEWEKILAAKYEQIAAKDKQIAALRKSQENAKKILAMLEAIDKKGKQ